MGVEIAIDGIDIKGERVGNAELHEKPPQDSAQAAHDIVVAEIVGMSQLRDELVAARNRAGGDLREEGYEEGEDAEICFGSVFAAIDIDEIAYGCEGIERDTDREEERHLRQLDLDMQRLEQQRDILSDEGVIFEDHQGREGEQRSEPADRLFSRVA